MDDKRTQVYNIISSLDGVNVYADRPEVLEDFPTVTYVFDDDTPLYDLDKNIYKQDTIVVIDIYTEDPISGDAITKELIERLKFINCLCKFKHDVSDPSGIHHITTRFNF